MATTAQPTDDRKQAPDPAQLGADERPATTPTDDAHDMSTVMADADSPTGRPFTASPIAGQGSDFAEQRRQGATDDDDTAGEDVGTGQGMGHAASNGDEDLSERQPTTDQNPFTGGYGGGGADQPPADQTQHLGLNTPDPTQK